MQNVKVDFIAQTVPTPADTVKMRRSVIKRQVSVQRDAKITGVDQTVTVTLLRVYNSPL
jgi:hypothetical protein